MTTTMPWRRRRAFGARIGVCLFLFGVLVACGRGASPSQEQAAPAGSVISVALAIGTCDDVEVCERECDAGSADRCRRLAATYALGRGAGKDEARATALYEQACTMKDPSACVFAGQMHEYAHGVPKDDAKAASLYARSCDMEWPAGCYNLAIMYENGRGVQVDRSKAEEKYGRACAAGAKQACDKAKEMQSPGTQAPFLDGSSLK
jgi:TPR repeat protein